VIVITYAQYEEEELADYAPQVVLVDDENRPIHVGLHAVSTD
jgi:aspartate 1-decarboxylase